MRKAKILKRSITLMMVCMTILANSIFVSANELKSNRVIVLNNIEDIEHYKGADGIYEARLSDGRRIQVTIKTTIETKPGISTYATEYVQNKSYEYKLMKPNGVDLDWRSEVVGTFHFNNTYVWCTAGNAYYEFGDSANSIISYSQNTYSSAKTTGISKYQIKARIVTPTGTYNITQYVGSDPNGNYKYDMSF